MTKVTIGCDPEIFLQKGEEIIPAVNLVPGTKEEPFPVPGGTLQVDGLALELGTNPTTTFEEFEANLQSVIAQAKEFLGSEILFSKKVSHTFSEDDLIGVPVEALELGCDPDYNAYTLAKNPEPMCAEPLFRTAAGHLHFGWVDSDNLIENPWDDEEHVYRASTLIQHLDMAVGRNFPVTSEELARRKLYGKSGAMRVKPYGVEWRTPSNYWLFSKPHRKSLITRALTVADAVINGKAPPVLTSYNMDCARLAIDNGALDMADNLEYNVGFPYNQ